jgi:hypothetical protein
VYDGIHPSDRVHLIRDTSRLNRTTQIADDHAGGPAREVIERRRALMRSRVQNDFMFVIDERTRGGTSEAVGAAGDEDPRHAAVTG